MTNLKNDVDDRLTPEEVDTIIERNDFEELNGLADHLVMAKKKIENQLASSKFEMLEHRRKMERQGYSGREAQRSATQDTDQEWRRKASAAARYKDGQIQRVKSCIKKLRREHKSQPEQYEVKSLTGSVDEVVSDLQWMRDNPEFVVHSVIPYKDAVIVTTVKRSERQSR